MISAVIERCAGIDVGKKFLAVCVMTGPPAENATAELRSSARFERNWITRAMRHMAFLADEIEALDQEIPEASRVRI